MAIRILLSAKLGELRLKQKDLAWKTGIRANTISDMYNEMCESVKLEHLDRICKVLGCDLTDLLKHEPDFPQLSRRKKG